MSNLVKILIFKIWGKKRKGKKKVGEEDATKTILVISIDECVIWKNLYHLPFAITSICSSTPKEDFALFLQIQVLIVLKVGNFTVDCINQTQKLLSQPLDHQTKLNTGWLGVSAWKQVFKFKIFMKQNKTWVKDKRTTVMHKTSNAIFHSVWEKKAIN